MKDLRWNKRDKNGWGIPKLGTKSLAVYQCMIAGMTKSREIADKLGLKPNMVRVLVHRIKFPEKYAAAARAWHAKKKASRETT